MAQENQERQLYPHAVWPSAEAEAWPDDLPDVRPKLLSALFARLFALVALLGVCVAAAAIGRTVYYVATDSFVAPIILSSDSDLVLPSKLALARLEGERNTLVSRIEKATAASKAAEGGAQKLRNLMASLEDGLGWSRSVTAQSLRTSSRDLQTLREQNNLLRGRIASQASYVRELESQMRAGLVRKADVERAQDALRQLEVSALQVEREQLGSVSELETSRLTQRALASRNEKTPKTPEMLQQRNELIRLEVDIVKLSAEGAAAEAELRHGQAELTKLEELIAQVKARPVFRAIESQQHVAFVPYSQIEGAVAGAQVLDCELWGVFSCRRVGTVIQLLPGEIAAQDPWGATARGQYALLRLTSDEAAKSKTLRLRERTPSFEALVPALFKSGRS